MTSLALDKLSLVNSELVVNDFLSRYPSRQALRRFLAAAFLVFLLAEWGSHGLAFSHSAHAEGTAIYSSEEEHDDPCKTLLRCYDGRQQDQTNVRYDGSQHSAFLYGLFGSRFAGNYMKSAPVDHERVDRLLGSVSPPFHPPELSGAKQR